MVFTELKAFSNRKEVVIGHCPGPSEILDFVYRHLKSGMNGIPRDGLILVKPNFHKDLPSILSNTTDFRLIIAVVRSLQRIGYKRIVIGEGPACGFDFTGIDVFKRLGVPRLAEYLGVDYVNFNRTETTVVELWKGQTARIASIVKECDFFINLPKLKTHLLAQISAALKSLVGCFAGLQKREMHHRLLENIILVNTLFPADLIFIDALVAMEGQGPGIGTPVVLDSILYGKNPYTLDLACCRLTSHDPQEVKLIRLALKKGHLDESDVAEAGGKIPCLHQFQKAKPSKLVTLSALPLFNRMRNSVRSIYTRPFVHRILYKLELAEDVLDFDNGDYTIKFPEFPSENDRRRCAKYCPLSIDRQGFRWPEDARGSCLGCLYCLFLSGEDGARLEGSPGYLRYLLDKYRPLTTKLD